MTESQRRALGLLTIHEGACAVERGSELHVAFQQVERLVPGFLKFVDTGLMGTNTPMVNVYIFTFTPQILKDAA